MYVVNLGFCCYAMWPNPANDIPDEDEDEDTMSEETRQEYKNWEMQNMKTPTAAVTPTPFTPRTQAFHTLDRTLPLRQPSATGPRYV